MLKAIPTIILVFIFGCNSTRPTSESETKYGVSNTERIKPVIGGCYAFGYNKSSETIHLWGNGSTFDHYKGNVFSFTAANDYSSTQNFPSSESYYYYHGTPKSDIASDYNDRHHFKVTEYFGVAAKLLEVGTIKNRFGHVKHQAKFVIKESPNHGESAWGKTGWWRPDQTTIYENDLDGYQDQLKIEIKNWNELFQKQVDSDRCRDNKSITCSTDCGNPEAAGYGICAAIKNQLRCNKEDRSLQKDYCSTDCTAQFAGNKTSDGYKRCIQAKYFYAITATPGQCGKYLKRSQACKNLKCDLTPFPNLCSDKKVFNCRNPEIYD